ncbi:hypothetical protein C8R45DRAFT_1104958 [Mycena sanguinolenta]|nr:hypothetical protein C8R45DRAFT_1104958 [Mycena sanguinolenta]
MDMKRAKFSTRPRPQRMLAAIPGANRAILGRGAVQRRWSMELSQSGRTSFRRGCGDETGTVRLLLSGSLLHRMHTALDIARARAPPTLLSSIARARLYAPNFQLQCPNCTEYPRPNATVPLIPGLEAPTVEDVADGAALVVLPTPPPLRTFAAAVTDAKPDEPIADVEDGSKKKKESSYSVMLTLKVQPCSYHIGTLGGRNVSHPLDPPHADCEALSVADLPNEFFNVIVNRPTLHHESS